MHSVQPPGTTPAAAKPTLTRTNTSTPTLDSLVGRTVTVITTAPSAIGDFFSSVEGTDKLMKIACSVMLIFQLKLGAEIVPTLVNLQKRVSEGCKFLKIRRFAGSIEYFTLEKFAREKETVIKVASMALLTVSNTCEQLMWMGSLGILKLGQLAASVGRYPGFQFVTRLAIRNVHMGFAISGLGLMALHYYLLTGDSGEDKTFTWTKVADNVGKVALVVFSGWAATYGFATLSIVVSCIGLFTIWYRDHADEVKAPPSPPLAAQPCHAEILCTA